MKNKNRILTSIFVISICLSTAHAWKVKKDSTTQMKLTDDGRLWIGADGANGYSKLSTTTSAGEDRALDARADRTTGTNFGVVATASGNGAVKNIGLYGWAKNATNNYGLYVESGYGYFSDRVGIGTKSPNAPLEIVNDTDGDWTRQLSIFSPNATNGQRAGMITFGKADGNGKEAGHMSYVKTGDETGYIDFSVAWGAENIVTMNQDGKVGIGTDSPTEKLHVIGDAKANNWYETSDERLKKQIKTINNALEKTIKLRGVIYKWKDSNKSQENQIGFIAQEVEKIVPEVVNKPINTDDFYSMNYANLTALLVESIKELKKQNDALKALVCQDHPDSDICIETSN